MGLVMSLERMCVGIGGENLTLNVRKELVRSILHKQLCWFDRENHAPGVISTIFAEDISLLNGMTTETIIVLLEAAATIIIAVVISCFYCWE